MIVTRNFWIASSFEMMKISLVACVTWIWPIVLLTSIRKNKKFYVTDIYSTLIYHSNVAFYCRRYKDTLCNTRYRVERIQLNKKHTCLVGKICFYFSIQGWPQLSFQSHWQTTLVGSILGPRLVCLLLAKALTHLHTDLTPQVKAIHLVHFCQDAIREKLCPQESNLR